MNEEPEFIENYIVLARENNFTKDLYKLCLEHADSGEKVLLLTSTEYKLLSLVTEMGFDVQSLHNFVIMLTPDLEQFTKKLYDLHKWPVLPTMVVVIIDSDILASTQEDLNSSILSGNQYLTPPKPLLQCLCLCVARLFSLLMSIEERMGINNKKPIRSILILQNHDDILTPEQLGLMTNHFYKDKIFDDLGELLRNFKENYKENKVGSF